MLHKLLKPQSAPVRISVKGDERMISRKDIGEVFYRVALVFAPELNPT